MEIKVLFPLPLSPDTPMVKGMFLLLYKELLAIPDWYII